MRPRPMIDMSHIILVLVIFNSVIVINSQDIGNTTYNPEELFLKIFNINETTAARHTNYESIKFEEDFDSPIDENNKSSHPIIFYDQTRQGTPFKFENALAATLKFEDNPIINNSDDTLYTELTNINGFTFQDTNNLDNLKNPKKKQRKKPKNQNIDSPAQIFPEDNSKAQRYPGPGLENNPLTFSHQTVSNNRFKFESYVIPNNDETSNIQHTNNSIFTTQDENKIEPNPPKKKRRRRRRKPRYHNQAFNQIQGYPGYPGLYPGNGPQRYPIQDQNLAQGNAGIQSNPQGYPGQFGFNPQVQNPYPVRPNGQYYKPPRRPKQSLASEALSAVTGALTSIALYDDYQCVPRLLCEAAGGGALGSSSVLQNVAGLQPLLTLLAAYNGISSSPLFIFGRAVFLGMTAKGNLGTCRYAYPQCPNDPEQLVHYLNNHNGGFFRFFNAPQLNNPQYGLQNVEQFYNQLSQNYGFYQGPDQVGNQQNYGFYQPYTPNQQNTGLYQPNIPNNGVYQPNTPNQQSYGIYQPNIPNQPNISPVHNPNIPSNPQGYGVQDTNLNDIRPQSYGLQNYGAIYLYQNNAFNRFKSNIKKDKQNKIEKRIINGQVDYQSSVDFNDNPKWLSSGSNSNYESFSNNRGGKSLRFPDEEIHQQITSTATPDYNIRQGKIINFPQNQNDLIYVNYNIHTSTTQSTNKYGFIQNNYQAESNTPRYQNDFNSNNKYTFVNQNNNLQYNKDERTETVYIIRGNGDPNHPEIVKLKAGEKLQ
ncbi:uncharacterized protein LOC128678350 isoform X2 [Plodia interpunctella]|uniref:uncharacterized protein LOC128678350 isoform X2 n=1 Tax=Plodia interpunctella TaxID=58824 RepID=UPI0023679C9F|nr:uncharacterized protein LOC128678350 isoform X2 [Plodia interpunctella]